MFEFRPELVEDADAEGEDAGATISIQDYLKNREVQYFSSHIVQYSILIQAFTYELIANIFVFLHVC